MTWIVTRLCRDCMDTACEPECPWQAIFEEAAAPELFNDDIGLNRHDDRPDGRVHCPGA